MQKTGETGNDSEKSQKLRGSFAVIKREHLQTFCCFVKLKHWMRFFFEIPDRAQVSVAGLTTIQTL